MEVSRLDTGILNVIIEQGSENKSGTKHSLMRHYSTNTGAITAEDILRIPDILMNGERRPSGNKRSTYKIKDGKNTFTVLTEKRGNRDVFFRLLFKLEG